MGKTTKVVICGYQGCGKTSVLEQLIYGCHKVGRVTTPTIEDIYSASIDTDRGQKEKVLFYDTAGLEISKSELPKHLFAFADGYVLVYDVTDMKSFEAMGKLKQEIEKNKEKKEALIISLGNKCDVKECRQVDFSLASKWAQKEKVRLWEVSVTNRQCLTEPFSWIISRITQPPSKSTFLPALGRSQKQKAGNIE